MTPSPSLLAPSSRRCWRSWLGSFSSAANLDSAVCAWSCEVVHTSQVRATNATTRVFIRFYSVSRLFIASLMARLTGSLFRESISLLPDVVGCSTGRPRHPDRTRASSWAVCRNDPPGFACSRDQPLWPCCRRCRKANRRDKNMSTAKVHGANILVHLRVMLPRQHGAGKADFFHLAQNCIVKWQKSHTCVKRGGTPAFHTFVEDGVDPREADCVQTFRATGARGFHDFAAPALDVGEANAVDFEDLFDGVERCL